MCDGLGFGDNTKSALLTRGLVEMVRFTKALGGRAETCYTHRGYARVNGLRDIELIEERPAAPPRMTRPVVRRKRRRRK